MLGFYVQNVFALQAYRVFAYMSIKQLQRLLTINVYGVIQTDDQLTALVSNNLDLQLKQRFVHSQ